MVNEQNLIWIDLEMTGLLPEQDRIIEIATIVTDKELNILAEGPVLAIHQSNQVLDAMDEWNTRQHGTSGLTAMLFGEPVHSEGLKCKAWGLYTDDAGAQAAKEALMAHSAAKAKAAKEMRDKKNALETNYAKVKGDLGTVKKQVHDMTRTRKYVSSDAAETMRQKKTSPKPSGSA